FEEAIDRKALARVVYGGVAQPGCTPVSPSSPWYDESVEELCTPYDPADARKLVAASGIRDPTLHLHVSDDADGLRLAQFIQAQEQAVGIDVEIDNGPEASSKGYFEALIGDWAGGIDPDRNLYLFLSTEGSRNRVGYSNPRLDQILANGRKATSDRARR